MPKAHTPFGWLKQRNIEYFKNARKIIFDRKRELRAGFLQFKFHSIEQSILESALGRGDRRMSDVIERAWRADAKFDLWSECFNSQIWQQAFAETQMDMNTCAQRQFDTDEILPWEHLGGPEKKYLLDHLNEAMQEMQT